MGNIRPIPSEFSDGMEKKRLSLQAEDDIVYAEYLARRPRRRHAEDDVRISRRDAKDVQPGVGYFIYARRAGTARPVLWHCTRFDGR